MTLLGANTDLSCGVRQWAINILFSFTFGSLLVRVYRVWRLWGGMNSKRMQYVSCCHDHAAPLNTPLPNSYRAVGIPKSPCEMPSMRSY
mmetsp:Transcript_97451/g.278665  ORF Transcript_97451/g.278665 Transcript_97451/m.278665 type:complete len:89 (-) Transcript_97451:225-491(-)